VVALPKTWNVLETEQNFISVALNPSKKWIGYQFHPEKKQVDFDKYILYYIV
jgi:GMP synthase-like glutamine amidotransferase